MSKFGKYAIVDNVRYHLEKEPTLGWEVKPPTARIEISINRFTQGESLIQSLQGIERKIVTTAEIALEELTLTFAGSNIPDGDNMLFVDGMDNDAIKEAIKTFPKALFYELWKALGKTCPGWGAIPVVKKDKDGKEIKDEAEAGDPKDQASSESS